MKPNRRRAVFLDLGGTLVEPLINNTLAELTLIPGVVKAVARLSAAGFVCPVVTVQSGIAKGRFSRLEFGSWFANFATQLALHNAYVVGPYVCPHRFADRCPCEKPNTVLYDRAAFEHDLDITTSFVIGDSHDDIRAARRLGAIGCLVCTGWAADPEIAATAAADATVVKPSLKDTVDWILDQPRG